MKKTKKIYILIALLATVLLSVVFYPTPARAELSNFNYEATATNCTLILLNADEEEVEPGESVLIPNAVYSLEATATTGHTLDTLTVNGQAFTSGSTFTVNGNVSIEATATINTYDLTANAGNSALNVLLGESTVEAGENVLVYGQEYTLNAVAESGYTITSILVNGVETANGTSIVATQDLTIEVVSQIQTFDLVSIGEHATVSFVQGGSTCVNPGENVLTYGQTYSILFGIESYFNITSVLLNGVQFDRENNTITVYENLTFEIETIESFPVNTTCENVIVKYTFQGYEQTIITANSNNTLACYGSVLTIWAELEAGYTLNTFTVNGEVFTSHQTITVVDNVNITATATLNTYNLTTTGENATINLLQGETTITAGDNVLTYGQTAILNVLAEEGYQIDSILVNGVETENFATITFTENLTIEVVSSPTQTFDAIPEGMIFILDDTTMTASVNKYTGTETEVVIPSSISASSSTQTIATLTCKEDYENLFSQGINIYEILSQEERYLLESSIYSNQIVYPYVINVNTYTVFEGDLYLVTAINDFAFIVPYGVEQCLNLASIYIPNTVTNIGAGAFTSCENLLSVNIPNSVLSIGDGAFQGCINLSSVIMSNSVQSLNGGIFGRCPIESIIIESNPNYTTKDNLGNEINGIIDINNNKLIYTCSGVIPSSITTIGESAFSSPNFISIVVPSSVTVIENDAFYLCSSVESIIIPDSVISFGYSIFPVDYRVGFESYYDIFYTGTQEQWNLIENVYDNYIPETMTIHYNYVA